MSQDEVNEQEGWKACNNLVGNDLITGNGTIFLSELSPDYDFENDAGQDDNESINGTTN